MVRRKISKKKKLWGAFGILLAMLGLTFYLWHLNELTRMGYETGKLEEKLSKLQDDVRALETRKASLLSLERVEKIAKEDLKLREPEKNQVVYDDESRFERKKNSKEDTP